MDLLISFILWGIAVALVVRLRAERKAALDALSKNDDAVSPWDDSLTSAEVMTPSQPKLPIEADERLYNLRTQGC